MLAALEQDDRFSMLIWDKEIANSLPDSFPTVEVKDAVVKSDAIAIKVRLDKKLRLCLQNFEDLVDKICAAALFDSRSANLHNDPLYVFAAFQGIVPLLVYQLLLSDAEHWYRLHQALCRLVRCDTNTTANSVLN